MICPACGSSNVRTARVCATCGTILTGVPKTQFKYQQAVLPGAPTLEKPKTKRLSTISLILGLASLTPATFVTGIPAVICGALALKQRRPGFWQAVVGIATGAFGTVVLTFALLLPLIARQREAGRVAVVKRNVQAFKAALEDYAAEYAGRYPRAGISWEPGDDDGMVLHFKGGSQLPGRTPVKPRTDERYGEGIALPDAGGSRLSTGIPVNPYTGECYRNGKDFFYQPEALAEAGLKAVVDRTDATCPFVGLAAPGGAPGTIVILGWSPSEDRGSPTKYAVVGYGRNTGEPLAGRSGRTFFVLHN
jgi:hypothetical protein